MVFSYAKKLPSCMVKVSIATEDYTITVDVAA